MPIYEYRAAGDRHCKLCERRFELRQGMDEEPLRTCPECGLPVRKLISRPFVAREKSLSEDDIPDRYGHEEDDEPGLEEDFGDDDAWQ